MYSQNIQNGQSVKSNCVEVIGNNFPETHWDPNYERYWACNQLADSSQNHHQVKILQDTSIFDSLKVSDVY